MSVRLSPQADEELQDDEGLVFDWHRVAICCAAAGEVSLRTEPYARLERSGAFRRLSDDPAVPVFAHRQAYVHLRGRAITIDCRRRLGLRRFVSDLPTDFGLRASLGRLPEETAT